MTKLELRHPYGQIINDGTEVILDDYPDCANDGCCDCGNLVHDRASYDTVIVYEYEITSRMRWIYLCERCFENSSGRELGWGKAQRIVSTGTKNQRRAIWLD